MDFVEQASAATGQDYKFQTNVEILDGGNGAVAPIVLETWELYGCFLQTANYNTLNYEARVNIGGKDVEIKSSERNTITTILQTSYYKDDANKFYLFASNSKSLNLDIRIVSSQLLYRLNLGDDIADELSTNKQSQKLLDQINDGLATLDFPTMIQTSLATGESQETTKTFKVAKNVKIRFIISISS